MQVKKPGPGHPNFRILGPKGPGRTVRHEELDAINAEYRAERLSHEKAHALVTALARKLEPKAPASYLPENEALAEAYWTARIKPKYDLVAPAEAKRRIFSSVRRVGAASLLTTPVEALAAIIGHLPSHQRRPTAQVLNAIFRWRGMEKAVHVGRVARGEPVYLTLEELRAFSLRPRELQLCVETAFATGARYGELFTITPTSFREDGTHVFIGRQLKKGGLVTETKNRKSGTVFIIPELRESVRLWANLPAEVRASMREKSLPGELFQRIAWRALRREVTFHNLRHSYAKCCLSGNNGQWENKATLENLRSWMRDRMSTIEMYYASWVETSAEMQSNVRRFG